MIVVDESDAHAAFFAANSHRLRHVFELAVTLVAKEPDTITQTNRKIRVAIVVKISGRAAKSAAAEMDSRFLCRIFKSSIARFVSQRLVPAAHPPPKK